MDYKVSAIYACMNGHTDGDVVKKAIAAALDIELWGKGGECGQTDISFLLTERGSQP